MIKNIKIILKLADLSKSFIYLNTLGLFILNALEVLSLAIIYPLLKFVTTKEFFLFSNLDFQKKITLFLLLIWIIFIIKNLYIIFFNYLQKKIFFSIQLKLTKSIFKSYLNYNYEFSVPTPEMIRNLQSTNKFCTLLTSVFSLYSEILLLTSIIIFLLFINLKVSIAVLVVSFLIFLILYKILKKYVGIIGHKSLIKSGETIKTQVEVISGLKEIIILRVQKFFYRKFSNDSYELSKNQLNLSVIDILPKILFEITFITFILFFCFFLFEKNYNLSTIIPTIAIYSLFALRVIPSVNKILYSLNGIAYSKESLLLISKEISKKIKKTQDKVLIKNFTKIFFNNVEFKYDDKNKLFINLRIYNNNFYGLIGESGSGKSTFINLILNLLHATKGKILIDKHKIEDCTNSFRKLVGFLPQEVLIIQNTLKNNIALGVEKKDIKIERVKSVIKLSGLENFVKQKKEGINFFIKENGKNISMGQRQRIGIARVLYNNPKIIILDEPTSALDNENSNNFIEILNKIKKNRLIIVASHNIKNLKFCDKILAIKNNNIQVIKNKFRKLLQ
jgi:ABC-type bacteriocin/lantibiotic exporter with double-glycine peptidase domain